jgi:septal ring factor EnvC (AmiA/AmiB activator)
VPDDAPLALDAVPPKSPAAAAIPSNTTVEERRKELGELKRRLADLKARYAATRKKEADLKVSLEAAALNLEIQTAERRVLELRRQETEREFVRAAKGRDEAAHEVGAFRNDLTVRIAALYRLGRLGYLRTLAAADSGESFLRGLQVLTHLAERDATLLAEYQASLVTLASREEDLAAKKKELTALATESRKKEGELAAAKRQQTELLTRASQSSEVERSAVSTLEDKSERLARLLDLLEGRARSLAPGAASIRRYQGALDWPLKGKVAVPFGRIANPKFPKTFLRSSGWTLEAAPGTEVRSVFSGEVVYAQWLKGYGNLVVVDHGDGIFTLYGRLATGTIEPGAHVAIGDRLGLLGETPEDEVAGLYFEIRDNRSSVDPAHWLL